MATESLTGDWLSWGKQTDTNGPMHRSLLCLVALALVASPLACKKKDDTGASKGSEEATEKTKKTAKGDEAEPEAEDDKPKGKASKECKFPKGGHLESDWTVPEGCKLTMKENLTVEKGATLTIEPGAKLSFDADHYLWISHGKLVAKGTEESPIVLTSSNSSPAAGDWEGVLFDAKASGGNVLDHVKIEYAGKGGWGKGAVSIYGEMSPNRLTITNSTFQHNSHAGIFNDKPKSRFSKVEGNTFKDNGGASMTLDPDVIGSVSSNKLDEPIKVLHGEVTTTAAWPKAPAYLLEDNLNVAGKGQAAILTLPEKVTVKVAGGKYIWLGGADGGGLVAKGVTFTSANGSPAAGDWEGIILDTKTVSTSFDECVFEYAGHSGHGKAAITYYADEPSKVKGVKITKSKFRHNEHGGISPHGAKDCGALEGDNKSEGQPLCVLDK